MTRYLQSCGMASVLVGLAVIVPPVFSHQEHNSLKGIALAIITVGGELLVGGTLAIVAGIFRGQGLSMPGSVRAAVMANILFLAFVALEVSDGLLTGPEGFHHLAYFILFPPTVLLLAGLLMSGYWAWWLARGLFALLALWFFGVTIVVPFADIQSEGIPIPWYGRVYMVCVGLTIGSILLRAYWSLGRSDARRYFRIAESGESVPAV